MEIGLSETADVIAERLLARRAEAEVRGAETLSVDDHLGLIEHVYRVGALPGDVPDALQLVRVVRARLDHAEMALMHAGRRQGLTFEDLARPLGLRTRQAADQRLLRLESLQRDGVRSDTQVRAGRAQARWLARRGEVIRSCAVALASAPPAAGWWSDEASDLADLLAEAASDPEALAEVMAWLSSLFWLWRHDRPEDQSAALREAGRLAVAWDRLAPASKRPRTSATSGGRRRATSPRSRRQD